MKTDHPTCGEDIHRVFSEYVANLDEKGEIPDAESYLKVRQGLKKLLVSKLKRRGLWTSPPEYLGIGESSWSEDALDALTTDAYPFTFVDRLRGMKNQQRLKPDIGPMVARNVSNFVTDRQKENDPLGYRIFGRLRKAVELCIERGQLFVLATDESDAQDLCNDSRLGFDARCSALALREDLEEPVRDWNDDLLPGLIDARGRAVPAVIEKLAAKVVDLEEDGVVSFRLGDLAAVLKDDTRKRWDGFREPDGDVGLEPSSNGTGVNAVPLVQPGEGPDWPIRWKAIEDRVVEEIQKQPAPKLRHDLSRLWNWISTNRIGPVKLGRLPSYAELGRQLDLPRSRVRQLYQYLEPIVQSCMQSAE